VTESLPRIVGKHAADGAHRDFIEHDRSKQRNAVAGFAGIVYSSRVGLMRPLGILSGEDNKGRAVSTIIRRRTPVGST
jgi:hypothetical protein